MGVTGERVFRYCYTADNLVYTMVTLPQDTSLQVKFLVETRSVLRYFFGKNMEQFLTAHCMLESGFPYLYIPW